MKKPFPSFDLGIDHLFPSEPEERKQKREEQQRFALLDFSKWATSSRELKRKQQHMQQNTM